MGTVSNIDTVSKISGHLASSYTSALDESSFGLKFWVLKHLPLG